METAAAHTLRKAERLCGKKDISSEGKWGVCGHLRYCWAQRDGSDDDSGEALCREGLPNRMLVSVSKKFFKRAVKRNLLKRRMREAYRLQKGLLGCDGVDFLLAWSSKEGRGLPAGVVIERGRRLADGARRGCDGADPHRQGGRKTARGGFLRRRSKVRRRAAFRGTGRGGGASSSC